MQQETAVAVSPLGSFAIYSHHINSPINLSTYLHNTPYQPTLLIHPINPPYRLNIFYDYNTLSLTQAVSLLDKCGVSEYIRAEEDQNNNNNNNNNASGDASQVGYHCYYAVLGIP